MASFHRLVAMCLAAGLLAGCAQSVHQHQTAEVYSPLAEKNISVEIEALREELVVGQQALVKLTNSFAANGKVERIERGTTARERFYPAKMRYRDLWTEREILKRRVGALRIEREEYQKSLLLHH